MNVEKKAIFHQPARRYKLRILQIQVKHSPTLCIFRFLFLKEAYKYLYIFTDNQVNNGKEVIAASSKLPVVDNQYYSDNTSGKVEHQAADSGTNVSRSKIRRRTCYECGEKGHLSSACPKIQAADAANTG